MSEFLHLLKYKAIAFVKPDAEIKPSTVVKGFFGGIIYILFAYGIYKVTYAVTDQMLNTFHIGLYLYHKFIAVILLIFFITVNIGNILVSFTTLYKSQDVLHLLTKPVSVKNLFIVKFLDNFFYSSTTLFLLILSALLAYGQFFRLGFEFYFISVLLLILPYLFIAGLSGVLALFLIIKFAQKIGIRTTIAVILITYITGVLIFFALNDPGVAVQQAINNLQSVEPGYLFRESRLFLLFPNNWIANAFFWMARGEYLYALTYIIFLLSMGGALFYITVEVAGRFYYRSFFIISDFDTLRREKGGSNYTILGFEGKTFGSPAFNSEFKREFWMFFRDPVQVIHASLLGFLILMFLLNIGGKPFRFFLSYHPDLQTIIYLTIFLFTSFLVASLSLRFIFPYFNLWGQAFWRIKSSPVDLRKVLAARFVIYLVIMTIIAEFINYFINKNFSSSILMMSSIVTFFSALTMVSINYGMGAVFINLKEKNPIRISSSQGASISFLINMIYLVFVITFMFSPLRDYFLRARPFAINTTPENFSFTIGTIAIVSVLLSVFSLSFAYRSLKRDY